MTYNADNPGRMEAICDAINKSYYNNEGTHNIAGKKGLRPFALSIAIRKRHFYNKYATINNALCLAITASTLSSDYVANEAVIAKH